MTVHELKIDSKYFVDVECEIKQFEIRKNDRNFQVGDYLLMFETKYSAEEMRNGKPLEYTRRTVEVLVNYIVHGPIYGLEDGFCIMGIERV